jgi:hypothetical protein
VLWLIVVGVGVLALLSALLWALAVPLSEIDDDPDDEMDHRMFDETAEGEHADRDEAWVPEYSNELD